VILVDARGHGASDKPHSKAEYTKALQVADIVAVLRDLDISRADYLGYSMGGQIGSAMAQYAPEWVRGLIIGGAAGGGLSRAGDRLLAALEARGVEAIPAIWGVPLPPALHARLLANDVEALKACRADSPGFAAILSTMTMPCLVYAGAADPSCAGAEAAVAHMPNAKFFTLPGLGHADAMLHSELVLPRVVEFLSSLGQ
jgi:pimeloyl-ACP methyl ester carboxylesterase